MKKTKLARIISFVLALVLVMSVFSGVFTVSAACNHSYIYTLTKEPSESANGSRHGVCSLCGNETDEIIEGMLTNINYTPDANYNYGTTHDVVGAVLPEQPTVDTALHFVNDLGGKEGNTPANAAHNTKVLTDYLQSQVSKYYELREEHVDHIYFGEGTYYFAPIPVAIWQDESWRYYGRFTMDGVKGKTKLIVDDKSYLNADNYYGMFTAPTDQYTTLYTTLTDITFTTRTYEETGKPSKTMNFVDGGYKTGSGNLPVNLQALRITNCVISGFNSIFTGCSSIAGPYISNSNYIDFGDTFFQGCGFVDMKVTNNVIKGYGYQTSAGYEPSYFEAQSTYCSGIISNNKLYNLQYEGTNRANRFVATGDAVTPFANNYCERVYGVRGVQTSTGNDFVDCSKQDMIDFLKTRGTVSSTYLNETVSVIEMSSTGNRYSSDDMTGTYLLSSSCNELLDNAFIFGKIGCDHLYYLKSIKTAGNDANIDLSMFPLKYVQPKTYCSGTHLNLNGKSVYSRYHKNASNNTQYGDTSLFDEYGNEVAYIAEDIPAASNWTSGKSNGSYEVLKDGRIRVKASKVLSVNSGTGSIAKFVIDNIDLGAYRRYFIDTSKIELISGDYKTLRYLVTITDSEGNSLANMPLATTNAGVDGYVVTSGGTAGQTGKMTVTLQIDSPIASESTPLEVVVPPIKIERYSGMSTGEASVLNTFETATDYSKVGADYDEVYAAIDKATSFASPEKVEKVYFNKTYGHLRTFDNNGNTVENDTLALQTALNDIKDTNKELVLEEGTYNVMYNMALAKKGIKTGSLYLEGGSTYRIRALGEVKFGFKSDMDSGAFFYQKGEGTISGYMINIETTKPFESTYEGCVFDGVNFKNFMIDDCILGGGYSLFENCTFDSSIYQNGYLAKSCKVFNNSTVTNSCIMNNYVHIGWVPAEGLGQEGLMDAGWLFYDSAFLNSTYQDNWCEYIRFNNGGWYEKNGYKASNSLYTGNILDYTVEIRLGYGDIAMGNGNYHCSKWDLLYNDKNVSNMTYEIVNRSVGTYHISSGVTVVGNSFTGTAAASPAIYFDGCTNAANANGTKAIKNATVFGNNYTYNTMNLDVENSVFAVEGEVAETNPSLDLDRENSLYKKLDAKGSTGNYFDFALVNFQKTPNYVMPGTIIQSGDVMGQLGYNAKTGEVEVLTLSGKATGAKPITADMIENLGTVAYYDNGAFVWPEFTIKDGDYELKYGVDYIVMSNAAQVREGYTLKIDGMGKYYGRFQSNFSVAKAPLDKANVKLSFDSAVYDGNAKTPSVVYAYYNHTDISGNYELTYSDHNVFGKCYAILTAPEDNAKFAGSKRVEFNVTSSEYEFEQEYVVEPTCTEEGYTSYFCWHCYESIQADFVPATGHNIQEIERKDATCTAEGYVKTACVNGCGLNETTTLEKVSHVNRFFEKPATCLAPGEMGRKCILCNGNTVFTGTTAPSLGHGNTYEKVVKGTCKTAGAIQTICEDCGSVRSSKALPLDTNDHDWVVKTLKKAATCTQTGLAEATCSACGTYSANAVLPALGHTEGETVVADGARYVKCSVCFGVCSKENIYDWDFTNSSTGAADAKEFEAAADISVNNSKNYYSASVGAYAIPYVSTLTTSATTLKTPNDSTLKSFDVTTKGDYYNNCASIPGVIFATDENGIYTYNLYMGANCVNEVVYYIPYVKSGTKVTGFGVPWELTKEQAPKATVYQMVNGRKKLVDNIYTTFGFMPGVEQSRYADITYHLTVDGDTVKVYADVDFCFDLVENADPTRFSLVTKEQTFTLENFKANASTYYGGKYSTSTNVSHNNYEVAFGVYQYTRSAPNTATQLGYGEIKGMTAAYATEVDCEHISTKPMSATAATCTENGRQAGTVCADCGIIMSGGAVIPALGHDYKTQTVAATCEADGSVTTTCSRCDYNNVVITPATGHNYGSFVVTKAATCEETGVKTKTCTGCSNKLTETIPAIGHSFSDPAITKQATCTEAGTMTGKCSNCGETTSEEIPALGHDLSTTTVDGTCQTPGSIITSCSRCDYENVETTTTADHSFGDWIIDKRPSESDTGTKHRTCSACGHTVTETIPALGDAASNYNWYFADSDGAAQVADALGSATHIVGSKLGTTTADTYKVGYDSASGALELTASTAQGTAINGLFINTPEYGTPTSFNVVTGTDDATTTYNLHGAMVAYGEDDTYIHAVQFAYFNGFRVNVYDFTKGSLVASDDGYEQWSIASCKQTVRLATATIDKILMNGEVISSLPSGLATAANMQAMKTEYDVTVENGTTTVVATAYLTLDGNSYEFICTPIIITNEGAVTYNGTSTATVTVGKNYENIFGVLSGWNGGNTYQVYSMSADYGLGSGSGDDTHTHNYTSVVTAPTCTAAGYTTYTCTCGNSYKANQTAALGHDHKTVTVDATCDKAGSITTTCSRCDYSDVQTVPALGHDYKTATVDATCTQPGSVTTTCSRCDYSSTQTIAAKGHTESGWIVDKAATETEAGSKHTECTVCGETMQTATIPATGAAPTYKVGDANGDGVVTIIDAIAIARHTSKLANITGAGLEAGNVNGDAGLTIVDAVIIARYTSKIITKFPVEE